VRRIPFRAVLAGSLLLSACSGPTPEQLLASAQQHVAQGDLRAALIEVKSALQASPDDAAGRRLLGELYLAVEDGAAAEQELRRAKALGAPADNVTLPLVKALLFQGRFDEVLALVADPVIVAAAPADFHAARALAHLGLGDGASAGQAVATALAADPQNAFGLLARARTQAAAGKVDDAIAAARELVRLHPKDANGWSTLGGLLVGKQDFSGAENAFTQAIAHRRRPSVDRLQRLVVRVAQSKLDLAQQDLDVLLGQAPKSAAVQYAAGLVYTQRGQPVKAIEALELSYQGNPDHPATLLLLARNHAASGQADLALLYAERLVDRAPTHVPGRLLWARLLLADRKAAKAAETLRSLIAQDPDLAEARQLLAAALLHQGEPAEAERLLAGLVATQPDSPHVRLQLGAAQIAGGRPDIGVATLEKAGQLAPDALEVQSALAVAQLRLNDADDALATAQRYAAEHPEQAAAHNLEGTVRLARKEIDQAAAAFGKALAAEPGNATASRALAAIAMERGDLAKAEALLAEAASRHPEDLGITLTRAAVLERQGKPAEIKELLAATVKKHPDDPLPRAALGRLLLQEGKAADAVPLLDVPSIRAQPAGVLLLSEAWRRTGDLNRAKTALEELDRANPKNAATLAQLVALYEAQADWAGVERVLDRLLPLAPDAERVKLVKVRLLAAKGQADEAKKLLEQATLNPADREVLRTRIVVARMAKDVVGELAATHALLEREPSTSNAVAVAAANLRAGRPDVAVAVLLDWTAREPDDTSAPLLLAGLYFRSGRNEEGASVLRRILARDPRNVVALNELAWQLRTGDPRHARQLAEQAYALAPGRPAVVDTLAMALLEEGEYAQALEMNDRASRLAPQQPEFRVHRAEVLGRAGDTAAAAALLDEVLAQNLSPALRQAAEELKRSLKR
jgi:putative PEP-CTERM system TPR-repeat lipoprotein